MPGKEIKKLKMLSTLKEKKHYLVLTSEEAEEKDIKKAILDFIGVLGYAKAGIFFVEQERINSKENCFILSVTTSHVDRIKVSISLMKPKVRCLGVSGTIKKAREKFLSSITA